MRHYEAMYIVDADTSDENLTATLDKYKKVVTEGGGEVADAGKWEKGRRPLAYEIKHDNKKKKEGMFLIMHFTAGSEVPKELDRIFRISDEVIRHIIVRENFSEE